MPPLIAGALVSIGVSGSVAGIIGNVIFSGAMVGLSLLFAPDVPKPEGTKNPLKQSIPPRIGILGTARSAGAYMLFSTNGGAGISVDVIAICDGESSEIIAYYLHDDPVELTGNTVDGLSDGRYVHNVTIYHRLGLPTETHYPEVITALGGSGAIWTSDHRGDGITSCALICPDADSEHQAKRYPFGLPVLSVVVNSRRVFDPRDGDQIGTDPDTWSFAGNDNPILQAMTFAITPVANGGLGLDYAECFAPVIDEIAEQADICDEDVALKLGGTHKRYTGGGVWRYSDNPGDVLAAMLGAADGFMVERGDGAFTVRAGKFQEDDCDITFTDKHIVSLRVRRYRADEDDTTGVVVKYNSPPHHYTTVDAPVWPRDAFDDAAGSRRIRTTEVVWCQHGVQAQRLSKRIAIYEMAEVTGTMVVTMIGITVLDRRFARIQCTDDPALEDAVIHIKSVRYDLTAGLHEIEFAVIDPVELDAWDKDIDEGELQPVVNEPLEEGPTAPGGITAVAEELAGSVRVVLVFEDPTPDDGKQGYGVHYRVADIGGGTPGGWSERLFYGIDNTERAGGDIKLTINAVPLGVLEFEVASVRHDNYSAWSAPAEVDTGNPAPGRPNGISATLSGADVVVEWTAPDSTLMYAARVYRATTGAGFGAASDISGAILGTLLDAMSYIDVAPSSATYDYWVVAEDSGGIASTADGPDTVTVP